MENRCIIISGGVFGPVPEKQPGDFIIACDRGYVYCERLGLTPDLFIGDFDSYSGAVAPGVAVERLIPEKDDTDTGHAITYALSHGFRELVLVCALGGRLDHTLVNVYLLVMLREQGKRALLLDDGSHTPPSDGLAPNARQSLVLERALHELDALLADIAAGSPYDCCSVRLDAAAALLGEVTGLDSPEEVLNRVFSSFCIGK